MLLQTVGNIFKAREDNTNSLVLLNDAQIEYLTSSIAEILMFFIRTVSRTGTGPDQNYIIGCRYFLKKRRLYQTTGTNQQFFIRCRYFSCFYLFVTL